MIDSKKTRCNLMNSRAAAKRTSTRGEVLEEGREAFRKRAWGTAFARLTQADLETPLEAEDLLLLGQAAQLIGRETEAADLLARTHQAFLSRGETQFAARCAFWMGFQYLLAGEFAKSGGWLSRAARLLDGQPECVENGYLLLPAGYRSFHSGDAKTAHTAFLQATSIGERFADRDLVTLGLQGQGRALIRRGEIPRGVALLDEAMVAVVAGEVSPLSAGGVYCSVLDACGEIFDLRRAQEWTSALERWCESQPDLVPYRGHCLIRRAELLQLHGSWEDALDWAQRATEWLALPTPRPAVGSAYYQVGEIRRLRGMFAEAEEAYRLAGQWLRNPGPGMAQLQLAKGRIEAAHAAIRRMAEEVQETCPRCRVLDAYVEIALAAREIAEAGAAATELAEIAERHDVPFLRALSRRACGSVLLAEGNPRAALVELRQSYALWCDLEVPYEACRARLLIAAACRALGEQEDARLELTGLREGLERLGAQPDLARVDALLGTTGSSGECPLTEREVEVLRLVAAGLTNREIAGKLKISEKTVARHLSNIFTKLNLSTRTAAAAWAYDHGIVDR
jgi:DNA-binding CsgD family transcriptional regulator